METAQGEKMNKMNKIKFGDIEIKGQFVYNNCLFVKSDADNAIMGGSKNNVAFQKEQEVGQVVDKAFAPGHEPSPESEEETETETSSEKDKEDE